MNELESVTDRQPLQQRLDRAPNDVSFLLNIFRLKMHGIKYLRSEIYSLGDRIQVGSAALFRN